MAWNDWLFAFVFLALSSTGSSLISYKDNTYYVPASWNGRQDWQKADLVSSTDSNIVVTLKSDQSKKHIEFSKDESAGDKPLKEKDITIGMEVLARFGIDANKNPVYTAGTILERVRKAQYNIAPSCQVKAMPLGVGSSLPLKRVVKIPDNRLTASSQYSAETPTKKGRLGLGEVWCPSRKNARGSWLQVDLGLLYYICSVAVQGNTAKRNEWVKQYTISLSDDGKTFVPITENGNIKEFPASRPGMESHLHVSLPYRFLRFYPRDYHSYPCMGVEVYGFGPVTMKTIGQQINVEEIRAIGNPLAPYLIVPFNLKQRKDWRLAKYIFQTEHEVSVKVIPGPQTPLKYGSKEIMLNLPPRRDNIYVGRAVYVPFAKDKNGMDIYSVGRVGMAQNVGLTKFLVMPICSTAQKSFPVGVGALEDDLLDRIDNIPDKQMTATSNRKNHEATYGRLGNSKVWCAENGKERTSRFQIDLGNPYFVCSVAIQGQLVGDKSWVTSFKMAVSNDGRKWSAVRGPTGSDVFQRSGVNAAEFPVSVTGSYRHFSFNPLTFYKSPCMGVELYGVGPIKGSMMFDIQDIRIQGNACELQNQCPHDTECNPSNIIGTYTCKCPEGYMSSASGLTIIPGTDQHCRSINPTGKALDVRIEKMPTRSAKQTLQSN